LKEIKKLQKEKTYQFNPNFISDFKGYQLGMSVSEIDRLLEFRKSGLYVNSAEEFQNVTGISDSLLKVISPSFKFPSWVNNKQRALYPERFSKDKTPVAVKDINLASAEDLIEIYGIGPALSERILKQRETLGGFSNMEMLSDVWGLSPEVVEKLKDRFEVKELPNIKKVHINTATMKELSQFPYFRYPVSRDIVTFRSMNGSIKCIDDLAKIKSLPPEKIVIIAVYLDFQIGR
jgi:competence ComEA-like helix-hairpin-helix protein